MSRIDDLLMQAMGGAVVIDDGNTKQIDKILLDENGVIKPFHHDDLRGIDFQQLRMFCHKNAVYQLPTIDLITFLSGLFEDEKKVIEVGSGTGVIGRNLGIKMYDSHQQTFPEVKLHYDLMKQPTIKYGRDVLKMDGVKAIRLFKPSLVLACWVTAPKDIDGNPLNMYGMDEEKILSLTETYVHVGTSTIHSNKLINKYDRFEILAPWIVSRRPSKETLISIWTLFPIEIEKRLNKIKSVTGIDFTFKKVVTKKI